MLTSPALVTGRVASLHLHPRESGEPLKSVEFIQVIEQKGIVGNVRYFGRMSRSTGLPTKRQITLIEREQIAEHAATLGLETLAPGVVRSNIETMGINLVALLGRRIALGEALLLICEPRTPCAKMDSICPGLRGLMEGSRQGVLAQVLRSGRISKGDIITLADE